MSLYAFFFAGVKNVKYSLHYRMQEACRDLVFSFQKIFKIFSRVYVVPDCVLCESCFSIMNNSDCARTVKVDNTLDKRKTHYFL